MTAFRLSSENCRGERTRVGEHALHLLTVRIWPPATRLFLAPLLRCFFRTQHARDLPSLPIHETHGIPPFLATGARRPCQWPSAHAPRQPPRAPHHAVARRPSPTHARRSALLARGRRRSATMMRDPFSPGLRRRPGLGEPPRVPQGLPRGQRRLASRASAPAAHARAESLAPHTAIRQLPQHCHALSPGSAAWRASGRHCCCPGGGVRVEGEDELPHLRAPVPAPAVVGPEDRHHGRGT
jgi:hypothetical protein